MVLIVEDLVSRKWLRDRLGEETSTPVVELATVVR